MGYFLSKAKLNELHGNQVTSKTNLFLSILMPSLVHTMYDALLTVSGDLYILTFFIFDLFMVIYCFGLVKRMSSIQYNVSLLTGSPVVNNTVNTNTQVQPSVQDNSKNMILVCPICKRKYMKGSHCSSCGYKN